MKLGPRRALAAAAAALVAVTGTLSMATTASAGPATSPFDPPAVQTLTNNNGATQGVLSFYDAAGAKITGGPLSAPPEYIKADTDKGRTASRTTVADTLATAFIYTPVKGQNAGLWSGEQISASDAYLGQSLPGRTSDGTALVFSAFLWTQDVQVQNANTDPAWQDLYQVRILTSGPGQAVDDTRYASATVSVDPAAGTWTQVYPVPAAAPASTTTTLNVSPAGPVAQGSSVTLTATVAPASAAGTVQFKDGSTNLGGAVAVSSGTASTTTSSLPAGTRSLTAVFTPTTPVSFAGSTSPATTIVVTPPAPVATTTTTSLAVTPGGPVTAGDPVTLTASVTPTSAAGSVQFKDGTADLGAAVPVVAGSASRTTSSLSVGSHSLTAVFTPTDPAAFTGSTSSARTLVVTAPAGVATTTTLSAPAGPVTAGDDVTLTATLSPSGAVGSVQFLDGGSPIGAPQPVTSGSASLTTNTLGVGTRTLSAQFLPTDSTQFATSTSTSSTLKVQPPATATALTTSPSTTAAEGAPVTLTAAITPSAATGSVQFFDGTTQLGSPSSVVGGSASITTTTLPAGTRSLTAQFVPANPQSFQGSTSAAVSFIVTPRPPATTTTTDLALTPAGPVTRGDSVTLTATVSPSTAAGSIQFLDGATTLGAPQVVTTGGTASLTTTALPAGVRSLTAQFQPADPLLFAQSQSPVRTLTVNRPPAVATTTTLAVTPAGPVVGGTPVTLTATVAPSAAAGAVQFLDGTMAIGAPQALVDGVASLTTTTLPVGERSLTAQFIPTDALEFLASTSAPRTLTVTQPPTVSSTALAVTPAGGSTSGSTVTLTATVSPAGALGSVQFRDGTTDLGAPVPLSGGTASSSVSTLAVGKRSLTATFVPTVPASFATSTSPAVVFEVRAAGATGTGTGAVDTRSGSSGAGAAGTGTASRQLPRTGAPLALIALSAVSALGAGGALLRIGSRRRRTA